jgi:molecular chaperone IbpA
MTLNTIPHFDPFTFATNLTKSSVGFDELFSKFADMAKTAGYPPYNIKKTDENTYVIEMAVAGFGKQDIELTFEENVLTIRGELKTDDKTEYLFKGIADRAFTRKFTLADTIEIKDADLINGMLRVWLERFIPESKKVKKIDIKTEAEKKTNKSFLQD